MKYFNQASLLRLALPLALIALAGSAAATPVFTTALSGPNAPSTTTDEITFAADVSSSDLLHGIVGTGGTWNANGATPEGLNDGNSGGDYDASGLTALVGKTWAKDGDTASFREFVLGPGTGFGFDITEIQSIASWQGAGFPNQKYDVSVRYVGDALFTALTLVEYQPFPATPANNGGSTKVNVTDSTGVLASGVEAIRFDLRDTISSNGGGTVFAEIDVFGSVASVGPDLTAPTVSTLSPADGAGSVTPGANLVVTFDENIAIGTGNITIKDLDTPSQTVIPVGDAQVTVSGAVLTINPSANLDPSTNYAVQIDATAIDDDTGNSFDGILDDTTWNFTTGSVAVAKVFLLGGQSNMVGQAPSSGLPTSPVNLQNPQADVLFYYDGSALTTLRPGSGGSPPPSGLHFGPEVTFGRGVADASPLVIYALIKHGENGTALYNDWAPGTGASYTAFRNTVDAGLAALQAAGYATEIVGMLFHQGESDAIEGQQANYQSNLTAFIADVRGHYGADLPFLIGEIRRSNGPAFVTVADAQIAVAAADPYVGFVPASDLTFFDTYHFDASATMTLGERFATGYAALTGGAGDTTPPAISALSPADGESSVAPGSNLVVTFDENIAIGSGEITLMNLDTSSQTAIPVGDAQVSVSGAVLTINPSADLAPGTNYAIRIAATAIEDMFGNHFVGIADDITWNFTTSVPSAEEFSTTELAYTADVSASDLLHGLTAISSSGWNLNNGSTVAELNDGIHGPSGTPVAGAWTTVGATVEYNLGTSPGGTGWDITSIQSIAAWVNVGFGNQAWTVEVKPVGGSYSTLATVNYQALGSGVGATKVTLSDGSGVLASGVEFIRFTANQVNGGANAGAFVWREVDVFGVPSGPDETPPTVLSLSPEDGANEVSPASNLVVTFDDSIVIGSGNITIKNLDVPAQTSIPVGDGQVSVSGAVLTVNPASDLAAGTNYAIQIDATAIDDDSGNSFAGISDETTWNFTTGLPDLIEPSIVSVSPADGSSDVPLSANLVVTFGENIALGTGNITIKNLDTASQTVIPVGDAQVSVSGAVLTINPGSNFAATTNYAVQIDSGAVTDLSGNPFAGIADDTTWNFTTASTPLRIMCLGDSITVGYTDNPSWANHPFMFGYRSGLYTRLTNAGYNFQFVGASTEPWTGISGDPTNGGTYTPALDLRDFGQDGHRGYGGAGIWGNVNGWIAADNPDVILLLIGINGIGSGSQAALYNLVNSIVTTAPGVHLIVAQITPRSTFNQTLYDYNVYIRDTLVPTFAGNGHKVTTVDLYSFFLTDPSSYSTLPSTPSAIEPGVLSNGINHPDNPHYDLMAQAWFGGIQALGLGPNRFDSWIAGYSVGGLTGFDDDYDRDGISNGLENFFGTDPSESSVGLVSGEVSGNTFVFTHPQNASPASDISSPVYTWSTDLAAFHADGAAAGGATVTFSTAVNTPATGTTTVTATTAGTSVGRLFVRVGVTQLP